MNREILNELKDSLTPKNASDLENGNSYFNDQSQKKNVRNNLSPGFDQEYEDINLSVNEENKEKT